MSRTKPDLRTVRIATVPAVDPTLELLREIRDRLDVLPEIRDLLKTLRQDPVEASESVRPFDEDARATWMQTIATLAAGTVFSVEKLRAHARLHPELERLLRGLDNRQIGNRLRLLANHVFSGISLRVHSRDETGTLWELAAVSDAVSARIHPDACAAARRPV
jgi:hypothetical protein